MIRTPKDSPLAAIRRLRNDEDFKNYITWLKEEQKELYRKLVASDAPHTPKLQGAIATIDEVLRVVDEADIIFSKRTK